MEFDMQGLRHQWVEELKGRVEKIKKKLGIIPTLVILSAKDYDEASKLYVNNKIKICEEVGARGIQLKIAWKGKTKEELEREVAGLIDCLNFDENCHGIILQLPFPTISKGFADNLIAPEKDVDVFNDLNKGKIMSGNYSLLPATVLGIKRIIDSQFKTLRGQNICVINRSQLVGVPLANLLINEGATVSVMNSATHWLSRDLLMMNADIIVSATGNRKIFNSRDISKGCKLIIDCSMKKIEGMSGVGDFVKEDVLQNRPKTVICSGYGQSGIATTLAVVDNLLSCCENNLKKEK